MTLYFHLDATLHQAATIIMGEPKLSGDKLNEERAFIKRYTEGLTTRKVEYPADFSTPVEDRPRKVAVIGVSDGAHIYH